MKSNVLFEQLNLGITTFVDQLPGYFLLKDLQSCFLMASTKTAKMVGFRNIEDMIGLTDYDIKCEAVSLAHHFQQQDKEVINNSKLVFLAYLHFSNEWKIMLHEKSILTNNTNHNIGICCYLTDITDYRLVDFTRFLVEFDRKHCLQACQDQFTYVLNRSYFDLSLPPRQSECLFFLLRGKSIKTIARILDLSPRTVESYIESIKIRLDCRTKAELIELAWQKGYMNIIPKSLITDDITKLRITRHIFI